MVTIPYPRPRWQARFRERWRRVVDGSQHTPVVYIAVRAIHDPRLMASDYRLLGELDARGGRREPISATHTDLALSARIDRHTVAASAKRLRRYGYVVTIQRQTVNGRYYRRAYQLV